MVISIVDKHGIFVLEGECQAPVAADIYRPMPLKLSMQRVHLQPGAFISFGDLALSKAKSCFLSRSEWFGRIFAFDPVLKNCSTPLCRKLFITCIVYINAIRRSMVIAGQPGPAHFRLSNEKGHDTTSASH